MRAFDLIELNGDDFDQSLSSSRKTTLVIALVGVRDPIEPHTEHDDAVLVFQHAWKLGFEGIISRAMDLHVPPTLLAHADDVIE